MFLASCTTPSLTWGKENEAASAVDAAADRVNELGPSTSEQTAVGLLDTGAVATTGGGKTSGDDEDVVV